MTSFLMPMVGLCLLLLFTGCASSEVSPRSVACKPGDQEQQACSTPVRQNPVMSRDRP